VGDGLLFPTVVKNVEANMNTGTEATDTLMNS